MRGSQSPLKYITAIRGSESHQFFPSLLSRPLYSTLQRLRFIMNQRLRASGTSVFGRPDHPRNPLFSGVSTQTTQPVSSFSSFQDFSFFGEPPGVDGRNSLELVHNRSDISKAAPWVPPRRPGVASGETMPWTSRVTEWRRTLHELAQETHQVKIWDDAMSWISALHTINSDSCAISQGLALGHISMPSIDISQCVNEAGCNRAIQDSISHLDSAVQAVGRRVWSAPDS